MYLKVTCFILILLFLIGCSTSETTLNSPNSAYVEERDYCYSSSLVTTWNPYRVSEVSNKKYLTEGAFPGRHTFFTESGYTKAKEKMKNCLKEKSNNLCKRVHKSKAINFNWPKSSKTWNRFAVLALSFDCDLSNREQNNKIKEEKNNIQELENLYQEACISSYNKLKKSNQKKYSLNNPLYIVYRTCLITNNTKIENEINVITRNIESLDNRAWNDLNWSSYKCQNEKKINSFKGFYIYNKLYLKCSKDIYDQAKNKEQLIRKNEINKIIKKFRKSKKYCESEYKSSNLQWRCFQRIEGDERNIAELEDHFWWSKFQCKAGNIFSQDRYRVYYSCLKSLRVEEYEDKAIERAKKAKEKKDREKAKRELAELEPYKQECESIGYKRKSIEMKMCITKTKELESQQIKFNKVIAESNKRETMLYKVIEELKATNNTILEEQKRQNYLSQVQSETLRRTQAIQQKQLNISQFQESMRWMGVGLGMMSSNQPLIVTCNPYLLNSVRCKY